MIVLGEPDIRGRGLDAISYADMAINAGGAALIAADTDLNFGTVWQQIGGVVDQGRIASARVECLDKKAVLDGRSFCPFVVPITGRDTPFAAPADTTLGKLFNGDPRAGLRPLTRVATNEPSYLTVSAFTGQFRFALARFPRNSLVHWDRFNAQPLPGGTLFAVGGYGPDNHNLTRYHFLAMADHSVFINQMLLVPDTDNLELTYRVIDYLRNPDPNNPKNSRRKRCLFIENGQVIERFDELRQAFKQGMPIPQVNLWASAGQARGSGKCD